MLHEELRQRLAKEFRYAVTRMQQEKQPARKLFYFSVFFGEAQRVLNFEWDRDLALIHMVTFQTHALINNATQGSVTGALSITWATIYESLTQAASDLATYFEKADNEGNKEELCEILGRLAEITFVVSGNGSYLYEKGLIKI